MKWGPGVRDHVQILLVSRPGIVTQKGGKKTPLRVKGRKAKDAERKNTAPVIDKLRVSLLKTSFHIHSIGRARQTKRNEKTLRLRIDKPPINCR